MGTHIVVIVGSLALILLGCELFTNAIEWFGRKLKFSTGAVGSIFAAVGTALPETLIPVVAILFHTGAAAHEIGVGAILGAPFLLATLALPITGLATLIGAWRGRRTAVMNVNTSVLRHDLQGFFVFYALAVGATFITGLMWRVAIAVVLLGGYAWYVHRHLRRPLDGDQSADQDELSPLYLTPRTRPAPRLRFVLGQLVLSLAAIVGGAHLFVGSLEAVCLQAGLHPLIMSLILAPIATELPEKFNSIIWIGQGKDTLALGNISGAMAFQSAIPVTLGILLTPWDLSEGALASAFMALASALVLMAWLKLRKSLSPWVLLVGAPLYALWLVTYWPAS